MRHAAAASDIDVTSRLPELRVFLIAGEPSGDALGGALMAALLQSSDRPVSFRGIGGPSMARQGLCSLFDYSELSVMGLVEVAPHIPRLLRRIRETAQAISAAPPDVLITIDSPGFVFRVIRKLNDRGYPRIHYVAPTVWAWRPGRARKFRRYFDHLLTLLPFEPPYFERVGLPSTFVGHPVVEAPVPEVAERKAFREAHAIPADASLLCMLPGSRAGEIGRHLGPFGDTLRRLAERNRDLHAVVPTLPHLEAGIAAVSATWNVPVTIVSAPDQKFAAMAASDVALAASGTVTLELAHARVPTVVAYRVAPATAWLVRRLVRVRHASIVNLIAGREVLPEFLQDAMRADVMAAAIELLLSDTQARAAMRALQRDAMRALGEDGEPPSRRAALAVLDVVRDWRMTDRDAA
jgi:lipid-A-disaccharide synthase